MQLFRLLRPDARLAALRRDLQRHFDHSPPGSFCFVCETDDGTPAGFIVLQLLTDLFSGHPNCHISDLMVAPPFEGQGLGRALIGFAERFAREHRCERLTLSVFPANERARALYDSAGFTTDLVRMAKPL